MCLHGGQAMPTAPNPRVLVTGMPTATIATPWTIAGCPGVPSAVPPCVTGGVGRRHYAGLVEWAAAGGPVGSCNHRSGRSHADACDHANARAGDVRKI